MVVSDLKGQLFEHPTLGMVGASGIHPKVPNREELSKLPEGSKFFTIPDSHPGGIDQKNNKVRIIEKSIGDGIKKVYDSELPIMKKLRIK